LQAKFLTLDFSRATAQSISVRCRISSPSRTKHCQQEIIDGVEQIRSPAVSPQSPLFDRFQGITGSWEDATAEVSLGNPTRLLARHLLWPRGWHLTAQFEFVLPTEIYRWNASIQRSADAFSGFISVHSGSLVEICLGAPVIEVCEQIRVETRLQTSALRSPQSPISILSSFRYYPYLHYSFSRKLCLLFLFALT
jgi:hypothetical protein